MVSVGMLEEDPLADLLENDGHVSTCLTISSTLQVKHTNDVSPQHYK